MNKRALVTVGLPRSGKSTWAKEEGVPIVNRDSIRLALHGKAYLQELEDFVSIIEENMVKSLFIAGHGRVIIDATHTTVERRERWIEKLKGICDVIFMEFRTSEDECIKRAIEGNREELVPIIKSMSKKIIFPYDYYPQGAI